ncbi:LAQU0S08e01552g1_1 [Lachancea quebecensis]|uniref:LAQU0S08e01552g1_1 n=1 Tax=Lachancea quebecensis TaxID=1654605 RepID=A0A0P1KTR6_9SACH|nr:LAQU0S08e01552g1_1 [Lachancea quebecensis]
MSGTGRLPTLNQGNAKPSLKFKPKALARRSKEEREASVPKAAPEEVKKPFNNKKKYSKRENGPNGQRRIPKYLLNTRVVNAGFGAENFTGGGGDMRTGFIKTEGSNHDYLQKGLKAANEGDDGLDSEGEGATKINMGREYKSSELYASEEEEEDGSSPADIDEDALQSKRLARFFPVRAMRVKHDEIDLVKKEIQDTMSDPTTRDPTPGLPKLEDPQDGGQGLQEVLNNRSLELQDKLNDLRLQNEFASVDSEEAMQEVSLLNQDYRHIQKKIIKINNQPGKFMFFQLPSVLPEFEEPKPPAPSAVEQPTVKPENEDTEKAEEPAKETQESPKKPEEPAKKPEPETIQEPKPLAGRIGALRIHKSGRLSVKIGNVEMDVSRGAENTFLQEVVALDEREEERTVELLGQIVGKAVVTPKF